MRAMRSKAWKLFFNSMDSFTVKYWQVARFLYKKPDAQQWGVDESDSENKVDGRTLATITHHTIFGITSSHSFRLPLALKLYAS